MGEKKSNLLFNFIAPIYGLFYRGQRERYSRIIEDVREQIDLNEFETALDVGCGTGALCAALSEKGLKVTGVDPAINMINIAVKKSRDMDIDFVQGDVLEKFPFEDKSFDIVFASYVAHGLNFEERKIMYAEMSRVAKELVVIHDYNDKKSPLTSLIEWLEGGDYFNFIRDTEKEMKDCALAMKTCFSEVSSINVDKRANWYICRPFHD